MSNKEYVMSKCRASNGIGGDGIHEVYANVYDEVAIIGAGRTEEEAWETAKNFLDRMYEEQFSWF